MTIEYDASILERFSEELYVQADLAVPFAIFGAVISP